MSNAKERPMAQTSQIIDTLSFVHTMKEGGLDNKAAEAVARTIATAMNSSSAATGMQLEATKRELKPEIDKVRTELKSEIVELRTEIGKVDTKIDKVRTEIDKVHVELQAQIVKLSSDINGMFFKTVVSLGSLMALIGLAIRFLTF